jgi:hypothetical protein
VESGEKGKGEGKYERYQEGAKKNNKNGGKGATRSRRGKTQTVVFKENTIIVCIM